MGTGTGRSSKRARAEGAYLWRAHWPEGEPVRLWQTYVQLAEAEGAFRTLKSEIKVRPIWHWTERRVEAHVLMAFLGYLPVGLPEEASRTQCAEPDPLADSGSVGADRAGGSVV
jgi:hypothetical protein